MHGDMVADIDGLIRVENGQNWVGSNTFDDIYAYYQYSDDADSPLSSETDDDGDHGRKKKKLKGQRDTLDIIQAHQRRKLSYK